MKGESITLYFREGSSDKVYLATLEASGRGYIVHIAYGRRGATLQTGTKTPVAVTYEEAKRIYDKVISEKKDKGYTDGSSSTPYVGSPKAERDTGLRPQLLNPITEQDAERYLADANYWLQEKLDGKRVLLRKEGGEVTGINRNGLAIGLPAPIVESARALRGDWILDGEAMGERFVAFDCLGFGGKNLQAHPYLERWRILLELAGGRSGAITVLPTAAATGDKRDMLQFLREKRAEGVVFKDKSAPYTPGRPASGGPQVKLKFYATASCIVAEGRPGKRSVALVLMNGGKRVGVGNVTIPANVQIPKPGQVVEVRYLYAYPGGVLYQPVFLHRRSDVLPHECGLAQLKYKRTEAED